jgi:hypothetical protein
MDSIAAERVRINSAWLAQETPVWELKITNTLRIG